MADVKKWVIAMTLLFTPALSTAAESPQKAKAEWCEQQWRTESAKVADPTPAEYTELLKRWQQYGPKCSGTVVFEARSSIIYSLLEETDKAREVLKGVAGTPSDYRHLADLSSLQADTADVMKGSLTLEDVRGLEEKYIVFVKRYPDFPDGYGILGGFQSLLDKHVEAIKSLEIGLRSSMDVWGVYRNLTISYTALGRYKEAIHAADEAFERNRHLTSDPYFAYALAKADAGVGNFKAADTVLRVIAVKVPGVRRDPEFKEAVDFVMAKMKHGAEAGQTR